MQYKSTGWIVHTAPCSRNCTLCTSYCHYLTTIDVTITVFAYVPKCAGGHSIVHHLRVLSVSAPTYWTSSLSTPCQVAWTITRVIT